MPTYNFSTITPGEALAITSADTLILDLGSGAGTRVLYSAGEQITIEAGTRTLVFGLGVAGAAKSYAGGGSLFIGGSGDDTKALDAGSDGLFGGAGNDTLAGGADNDRLQGNQGGDSLDGGAGYDLVFGGQDNDVIDVGATGSTSDFAQGNKGNDTILGSANGADTLIGGQGDDLINASSTTQMDGYFPNAIGGRFGMGSDVLNGNLGNDTIFGGYGDDRIMGEDGDDYILDDSGRSVIGGGQGNDTILTIASLDSSISGGDGNDILLASGASVVDAGAGDDAIGFSAYNPLQVTLFMGDGNDLSFRSREDANFSDRFTVDGGAGNDIINTGAGNDSIAAGLGADTLDSAAGADTLAGGAGPDTFEVFSYETSTDLDFLDHIIDWSSEDRLYFGEYGSGEPIGTADASNYVSAIRADYAAALTFANAQIAGGLIDYVVVQVGGDVYVFCDTYYDAEDADSALKIVGRSLADIGPANFTDIGVEQF